ncbi:solute carrier family 23 protein [Falsiroseomonas sp. HW251]|uniref:solute carrier family 23 protein n=1 Tax=Falsiroseomonas sp. HW251 TaxID=3390998 RepID=UPI003D32001B
MASFGDLTRSLARSADRPMQRPKGIVYWLDTPSPFGSTLALALQHVAVQSVYFILALAPALAISPDPADATRFLCLSILAVALWQGLQNLTKGPLGAGYPVPGTHAPAMLGAYAAAGQAGVGFAAAGAMVVIAGLVASVLSFAMRRLRVLIPNEVAGVVVMLIGVSLILLGSQIFGLQPGGREPEAIDVVVFLVAIGTMVVTSLTRTRLARLSVLVGAVVGGVVALAVGHLPDNAGEVVSRAAWFALPEPWVPDFSGIQGAPLAAFILALVAAKASAAGGFLMIQRAADAGWTRPDSPPVQRGLLANGVAIAAAGLVGAAAPAPATAAAGISVATGTLARRIVWFGTAILVAIAFCPKLVAMFVVAPAAIKSATLVYVSGFIMVQGAQLATVRLLDARRSAVVALGLGAGVLVAVSPVAFANHVPALASPLALGAVIAFIANLVTMPLVTQRAEVTLQPGPTSGVAASEWADAIAGRWGLKPQTGRLIERALVELTDVLAGRGVTSVLVAARREEDRVHIRLRWQGAALPAASAAAPSVDDLLEGGEAQEAFAVWLATREAGFTQRVTGADCEARLVFED